MYSIHKSAICFTKKKNVNFYDFAEEKEPKRIFYKSSERCNLNKCLDLLNLGICSERIVNQAIIIR
jgi:hypothetical protein